MSIPAATNREHNHWRIQWHGRDTVSELQESANKLGYIGYEISGDALAIEYRRERIQYARNTTGERP